MAQGGKFEHGFFSGFVSSLGGSYIMGIENTGVQVLMSAAIGGTAEALGGGKFANGAVTGAYVMMFNHLHTQFENRQREKQLIGHVQDATEKERRRMEYNRKARWPQEPQTKIHSDFSIEGSVNGQREHFDNVLFEIGSETLTGDFYYFPSENNSVQYIRYGQNPVSPAGNSFTGFTIEFVNANRHTVLYIVFPTENPRKIFNNYIMSGY